MQRVLNACNWAGRTERESGHPAGRVRFTYVGQRNEAHKKRQPRYRRNQQIAGRIKRTTAPVHAAGRAGIEHRALQRRRRVHLTVAGGGDSLAARTAIPEGKPPSIAGSKPLRDQRWRLDREWLSWRQPLAGHAVLRHLAFFNRKKRLAGLTVEHKHHAHLGQLNHDRDGLTVVGDIDQHRLGRHVIIPHIVMHQLLVPGDFTGGGPQCNYRVRVPIVAGPADTKKIR